MTEKKDTNIRPCKNCKEAVEIKAKECPHCGTKDPGVTTTDMIVAVIILCSIIGLVAYFIFKEDSAKPDSDLQTITEQAEKQAAVWKEKDDAFLSSLEYAEIKQVLKAYEDQKKGKTAVQKDEIDKRQKAYLRSLRGRLVIWSGVIDDIKKEEGWLTGTTYSVHVDMDSALKILSLSDVVLKTKEGQKIVNWEIGDSVTFLAEIEGVEPSKPIKLKLHDVAAEDAQSITEQQIQSVLDEIAETIRKQKEEQAAREKLFGSEAGAGAFCEMMVKQQLISPGSADFTWRKVYDVFPAEDHTVYHVLSYVDSQNNFGAMKRLYFKCKLKATGDDFPDWEVIDLELEGG